jgi:small subunit ribosomal protein S30e
MGKKHGSLARAGKVRKATKKVEKKVRTTRIVRGRAAMKQKYTKRIIVLKGDKRAKLNSAPSSKTGAKAPAK